MEEPVGSCCLCGRTVYCMDGFLNGEYIDNNLKRTTSPMRSCSFKVVEKYGCVYINLYKGRFPQAVPQLKREALFIFTDGCYAGDAPLCFS